MKTAKLTCPHCQAEQHVIVPENGTCLARHECNQCQKVIKPKQHCCVICEFSAEKCPVAKHD